MTSESPQVPEQPASSPPGGTMPPPYAYPPPAAPQASPVSAWAIASLIFGILGLVIGVRTVGIPAIAAVICGHAALADIRPGQRTGRGLAVAGLIMGYLMVALIAMAVLGRALR